jgi:hypothetical protein
MVQEPTVIVVVVGEHERANLRQVDLGLGEALAEQIPIDLVARIDQKVSVAGLDEKTIGDAQPQRDDVHLPDPFALGTLSPSPGFGGRRRRPPIALLLSRLCWPKKVKALWKICDHRRNRDVDAVAHRVGVALLHDVADRVSALRP